MLEGWSPEVACGAAGCGLTGRCSLVFRVSNLPCLGGPNPTKLERSLPPFWFCSDISHIDLFCRSPPLLRAMPVPTEKPAQSEQKEQIER